MRLEVYHNLRVLLMENEESTVRVLLQQLLSHIDSHEKDFFTYFKANYCNCLEPWASCFRVGTVVNTNMFVKSFHQILKIVDLQQKQKGWINFLPSILLKITWDQVFEQLTGIYKGKCSHTVAEINEMYKSDLNRSSLHVPVTQKDETCWMVPSWTDPSIQYAIQLTNNACKCKLSSASRHACVHTYTCTCMDATLHAAVCKHVH